MRCRAAFAGSQVTGVSAGQGACGLAVSSRVLVRALRALCAFSFSAFATLLLLHTYTCLCWTTCGRPRPPPLPAPFEHRVELPLWIFDKFRRSVVCGLSVLSPMTILRARELCTYHQSYQRQRRSSRERTSALACARAAAALETGAWSSYGLEVEVGVGAR